jgi:hypothetical protein
VFGQKARLIYYGRPVNGRGSFSAFIWCLAGGLLGFGIGAIIGLTSKDTSYFHLNWFVYGLFGILIGAAAGYVGWLVWEARRESAKNRDG